MLATAAASARSGHLGSGCNQGCHKDFLPWKISSEKNYPPPWNLSLRPSKGVTNVSSPWENIPRKNYATLKFMLCQRPPSPVSQVFPSSPQFVSVSNIRLVDALLHWNRDLPVDWVKVRTVTWPLIRRDSGPNSWIVSRAWCAGALSC